MESQVPPKQELMPQKIGNPEDRLIVAVRDNKISKGDIGDVKNTLKQIMVKIGLRAQNWPISPEKEVLIAHVVGNFGNHTHSELLLAFDMAIAGTLDVEVNCFENFSCLYFSNIMNAYRAWAEQAYRQNQTTIEPKALPEPKEDLSDQAMEDWLKDHQERKMAVEFMPLMLYDWCIKTERFAPTPAVKKDYLVRAVEYRQSKLSEALNSQMTVENRNALSQFMAMKEKGEFTGPEIEILKSLAKKMILYDYINF